MNLNQTGWVSATGQMAISVADGVISFYENGELKYSENYQLSTYNVYVYVFVSSAPSDGVGTDAFDNSAFTPNRAPSVPEVTGPSGSTYVGWAYAFSACSTDPDLGDMVQYTFDWGDGTSSTTVFSFSEETAYETHTWNLTGYYWVTVTARDNHGLASSSSEPLLVNIASEPNPPPNSVQVNIYAFDDYGRLVVADVSIDGGQYNLTTFSTLFLPVGVHTLSVNEPQDESFHRFISNNFAGGNAVVSNENPSEFTISEAGTVTAYYYITSNWPQPTGYETHSGYGSVLFSTDLDMQSEDLQLVNDAFSSIYGYFSSQGGYGHLLNYRSLTTVSSVMSQITDLQTHDNPAFFYYGHMGSRWIYYGDDGFKSFGIHVQGSPSDWNFVPEDVIWDTDVWPYTDGGLRFVFLWVCNNANYTGNDFPYTGNDDPGPHGPPYCWTRVESMSNDAYGDTDSSEHCFISFQGASVTLMESMNAQHQYNDWLVEFYRNLLEDHDTINNALDDASIAQGYNGWNYNNNPLYFGANYIWWGGGGIPYGTAWGKMSVYGDGEIELW